jgi:hypothetical protein
MTPEMLMDVSLEKVRIQIAGSMITVLPIITASLERQTYTKRYTGSEALVQAELISNLERHVWDTTNLEDKHMEPRHNNPEGRSISMDCQTMIKHMHDAPKNSASAITITCRVPSLNVSR